MSLIISGYNSYHFFTIAPRLDLGSRRWYTRWVEKTYLATYYLAWIGPHLVHLVREGFGEVGEGILSFAALRRGVRRVTSLMPLYIKQNKPPRKSRAAHCISATKTILQVWRHCVPWCPIFEKIEHAVCTGDDGHQAWRQKN